MFVANFINRTNICVGFHGGRLTRTAFLEIKVPMILRSFCVLLCRIYTSSYFVALNAIHVYVVKFAFHLYRGRPQLTGLRISSKNRTMTTRKCPNAACFGWKENLTAAELIKKRPPTLKLDLLLGGKTLHTEFVITTISHVSAGDTRAPAVWRRTSRSLWNSLLEFLGFPFFRGERTPGIRRNPLFVDHWSERCAKPGIPGIPVFQRRKKPRNQKESALHKPLGSSKP